MLTTSSPIETRLRALEETIADACREAGRLTSDVTLLAVSKRQPDDLAAQLLNAGHAPLGENVVQEWLRRRSLPSFSQAEWHLIGPIQTNKAKFVANGRPALVHSLDRLKLVRALDRALGTDWVCPVLIQVNIDREAQKSGVLPEGLRALADHVTSSQGMDLRGLMCLPMAGQPSRPAFARLRALSDGIADLLPSCPSLSMGMSGDFEDAIKEGATIVRIGSALFGPRKVAPRRAP